MADTAGRVWRRSSHCESNACVEVAPMQPVVAVRDGKDPCGPVLIFPREQWRAFVEALRSHDL